jgi:putative PIN family toxin of toxin-antitoxin system
VLALKLVIDTNVVVSGALKPKGAEHAALIVAVTPPAMLFVSENILAEYAAVLSRPELRIRAAERQELIKLVKDHSRLVVPKRKLAVCSDPDDDIFLECAETAHADYLITGNKKHFPVYWQATKIINARELLEIIAPHLPI